MAKEDAARYAAWRNAVDKYREVEERLIIVRMGKPSAPVFAAAKSERDNAFEELHKAIEELDS
jgi:hypothetical protein